MKRLFLGVLFFGLTGLVAGHLDFKEYGFSINSFTDMNQIGRSGDFMPIQLYKPSSKSGTTNVNVIIQKSKVTMEQYIKSTNKGIREFDDFEKISEKRSGNVAEWEYRAKFSGTTIHFLQKVILSEERGNFYLVTGASAEDNWKNDEKELRRMIDSFRVY